MPNPYESPAVCGDSPLRSPLTEFLWFLLGITSITGMFALLVAACALAQAQRECLITEVFQWQMEKYIVAAMLVFQVGLLVAWYKILPNAERR